MRTANANMMINAKACMTCCQAAICCTYSQICTSKTNKPLGNRS